MLIDRFLGWLTGRRSTSNGSRKQKFLVICHGGDAQGMRVLTNICVCLEHCKVSYVVLDLALGSAWPELNGFSSVVLSTDRIGGLDGGKSLELQEFCNAGGGLAVVHRAWSPEIAELIGLGAADTAPALVEAKGFHCHAEVIPLATGLYFNNEAWIHGRYDIDAGALSADCEILVSDTQGYPLCWKREVGGTRVVFWNTNLLQSRRMRGFLVQTIFDTVEIGVRALAGFAMLHIDDYPPSESIARQEPAVTEYGLSANDFIRDVWLVDMLDLRARYGLKYSWYMIADYADPDGVDFEVDSALQESRFADRINELSRVPSDDEIGFHGYNHTPMLERYWPDPAATRKKLERARSLWSAAAELPLPVSWVPASNWYNAAQIREVARVFPEISAVCSSYTSGSLLLGQFREFGTEAWEPSMLCLPRETYGHVQDAITRLAMASQVASLGIWTHFLHPDDIFDRPGDGGEGSRNPLAQNWKRPNADNQPGLYQSFECWIDEVTRAYPWLDFLTTSEATETYRKHAARKMDVETTGDGVRISTSSPGLFYVNSSKQVTLSAEAPCEIVSQTETASGMLSAVQCLPGINRIEVIQRRS
ncbi:DUF2194 domain-containing protein [Oricola sp.]|uniref:DUF2194 domain-containing protein n=1 Tax=Oricola sp. TaxID=1979950 RepID=UPI003BAC6B3F